MTTNFKLHSMSSFLPDPATPTVAAPAPIYLAAWSISLWVALVWNCLNWNIKKKFYIQASLEKQCTENSISLQNPFHLDTCIKTCLCEEGGHVVLCYVEARETTIGCQTCFRCCILCDLQKYNHEYMTNLYTPLHAHSVLSYFRLP